MQVIKRRLIVLIPQISRVLDWKQEEKQSLLQSSKNQEDSCTNVLWMAELASNQHLAEVISKQNIQGVVQNLITAGSKL